MKRIQSVSITNIKQIVSAHFDVGTLTVLQGDNGTGKTSILAALTAVFDGGHNPRLLRDETHTGEVKITLSDGITIRKRITQKTSDLSVTTADGSVVPRPATFVQRLASGFAFDPLKFLEADKKKRAQFLLEAMPIIFEPDEVEAAGGGRPAQVLNIETFGHYYNGLYERRRELNVAFRELEGAEQTMRKSLPDDDGVDHRARANELRTEQARVTTERNQLQQLIKAQADGALSDLTLAMERELADIRAKYDTEAQKVIADAVEAERQQTSALNAQLQQLASDLSAADTKAKEQERISGTKASLADMEQRLKGKGLEVIAADEKLKALDALKRQKLANAAIPGIEIRDGEIYVDGFALDEQNTQRQYFVAFQIAALGAGELGFMVCDRSESIVGKQWGIFQQAAKESGFQVIAARSEPEPLAVLSDGKVFPVHSGSSRKGKSKGQQNEGNSL
jgi:DNA repair exonuclease SbcCD ATPase subunit